MTAIVIDAKRHVLAKVTCETCTTEGHLAVLILEKGQGCPPTAYCPICGARREQASAGGRRA